MGIEKFYRTISLTSTTTEAVSEALYKNVANYFFLDFNSIIYNIFSVIQYELNYIIFCNLYHKTSDKKYISLKNKWGNVVHSDPINDIQSFKNNKEAVYRSILQGIEEYIFYILNSFMFVDKIEIIYIAIDGVPAYSKVIEQKRRRMMRFLEGKIIKRIKEKMGIKGYTYNGIVNRKRLEYDNYVVELNLSELVPYSNLMDLITSFLKSEEFRNKLTNLCKNLKIYKVSGNDEFGEGERKIIHYALTKRKEGKYMLLSPDGDVILLSLLLQNKIPDSSIKIIRVEFIDDSLIFNFINCLELKKNITSYIRKKVSDLDEIKIINDVVLLDSFFGNDFVPRIETINVRTSFNSILDIYSEYKKDNGYIINNGKINWKHMTSILGLFNKLEDIFAADVYMSKHYKNYIYLMDVFKCSSNTFIKKFNEINDKVNTISKLTPYQQENELDKDPELFSILKGIFNSESKNEIIRKMRKGCACKLEKKDNNLSKRAMERIEKPVFGEVVNIDIEAFKVKNLLMEYLVIFNGEDKTKMGEVILKDCHIKIKENTIDYDKYYKTYFNGDKKKGIYDYLTMFQYIFDVYFNDVDMNNDKVQTYFYHFYKSPLLKSIYVFLNSKTDYDNFSKELNLRLKKGYTKKYFDMKNHFDFVNPIETNKVIEFVNDVSKGVSCEKHIDCSGVSYFNKCHYKEVVDNYKN